MSEAKYTPGPWFTGDAVGDGMGHGCRNLLTVRPWPAYVSGGKAIAFVQARHNDDEQADCENPEKIAYQVGFANARLIAAAPTLLERLEAMQRHLIAERDCFYESCSLGDGTVACPGDQVELCSMDADIELNEAVIKAAKGEV